MAVLAEFLGQAGIGPDDSLKIWMDAARKGEVNDRVDIFYTYYRQFPCPLCKTLQRKADGYPKQGLGDLDYCQPDELCRCVHWPVEYARSKAARIALDEFDATVKKDPGAVYQPETLRWLKEVYESNPQEWERVKKILRRHKIAVKDLVAELEENEEKDIAIFQTPFIELDDGRLAEMVVHDGAAKFAVYDPATQEIEYLAELEQDGIVIVPPRDDEIFQKGYVTLPSIAEEYGDEMRLYSEIRAFVHKYLEVSEDFEIIACFYPMLTWVYDVMSVIVYLRAKGDWGTGKSRFLKVFSVLCYRAVSATGAISEAPIYRVVDRWRGTLTLDEADFDEKTDASASITKILNCGYERGKPVIRCDSNDPEVVHVFDPFGPKILATRYAFKDKALESRCFTELMKERTRKEIPIDLPPAFFEEALALRNKLLMYRFKNRAKIKERSEKGNLGATFIDLPDRMQQAARPLSIIVGDHAELQAMLKRFLEEKAKTLVLEASETIEGHIVKILADEEPEPNSDVLKWDLTISNVFERIKAETGDIKLKSGQVRNRANSLGLKTKRDYVGDKRQRVITCDKPLFDRLKRRYIPDEPDICYPGPDSSYRGCEIIWDDLDDLDNDGGCRGKNARNTDGRGLKPEREENEREERAQGIGNGARILDLSPRDRPDCPDRPNSGKDCGGQGQAETQDEQCYHCDERSQPNRSSWPKTEIGEVCANSYERGASCQHKSKTARFNRTSDKKIEWAKWTWNPYHGCLGHGCLDYCYARDIAEELYPEKFEPKFEPHRLNAPENTSVPEVAKTDIGERNVFVCSMGDLFGDWVPQEWIDQIIDKCRKNPQWNFLFLTKNPKRLVGRDWPPNCWIGTKVDVQTRVKAAEEAFRQIKAAVKFLSCEPLSEHVVFDDLSMFDWLIIGCRSKTKRLPAMQPEWNWVESLIEQGRKANLKIYMKPELEVQDGCTRLREQPTPETRKSIRETDDKPNPEKNCGSCPVALKGDRTAIKCTPCDYLGKAEAS